MEPTPGPRPPMTRLRWLAVLTLVGAAVGAVVQWVGGSQAGYLAIPLLWAVAWLAIANPACCELPPPGAGAGLAAPGSSAAPDARPRDAADHPGPR